MNFGVENVILSICHTRDSSVTYDKAKIFGQQKVKSRLIKHETGSRIYSNIYNCQDRCSTYNQRYNCGLQRK